MNDYLKDVCKAIQSAELCDPCRKELSVSDISAAYEVIAEEAVQAIREGVAHVAASSEPVFLDTSTFDKVSRVPIRVHHRLVVEWVEFP